MKELILFMPGRLCLFGEHSDWAGEYREIDPQIAPGYALICSTNQGITARVSPLPGFFELETLLPGGARRGPFRLPWEGDALEAAACGDGFVSYAASVASILAREYDISGLRIEGVEMNLPIAKGLSSSASICVLVARAANRLFSLGMDTRQEMDIAYRGELLTGSRCGRMDQACAYGCVPVFLTFDGSKMKVEPLRTRISLYLLIVDLCAKKDTRRILRDLNACFPSAPGPVAEGVRRALGQLNAQTLTRAREAVIAGDAPLVGKLMTSAQQTFDELVAPASPEELRAPKLHRLLYHPAVSRLGLGAKGVGSQGDGCAQVICPDRENRRELAGILEKDLGVCCLDLTIPATPRTSPA
jgi:galactokinase